MKPNLQPNKRLSEEIQELLQLDRRWNNRASEGRKILAAVLQAIKNALLRGEKVYVRGFGTFKVVERTHRPTPNNILSNDEHGRPDAYSPTLSYYKPRRVVVFEPSLPLMAMINMDHPNYKERRTQRSWQRR